MIPLSTNSGLIGWVPHCDTLHALIRDYREKKKILLNIEHRIMLRVQFLHPLYPSGKLADADGENVDLLLYQFLTTGRHCVLCTNPFQ